MTQEILSKTTLVKRLQERFEHECFKRMSEIPKPECLTGIAEAVEILSQAIRQKRKIVIVGDYDVDGVVGTSIVCEFLELLGAHVEFIIPNRFIDGYGLSASIIERLPIKDCVILTIDNGISAIEAAELCVKYDIPLIITDHHTPPPILPNAHVIVNPKLEYCSFPQKEICGATVAWYLIAALKHKFKISYNMAQSLDLLAFAIIADVMPLLEVNRILLKRGLAKLSTSKRPACIVLREEFKKEHFSSEDIAYLIAPLLNSAGRMADASIAVMFLRADNVAKARHYFSRLKTFNNERKSIESNIFEKAIAQIDSTLHVAVAYGEDWHEGVLGIVAARLCERTGKPSFVLTQKEGYLKGSGRSFGKVSLIDVLHSHSDLLRRFGGHKGAVGLEINTDSFTAFINKASENVGQFLQNNPLCDDEQNYIGEISPESIDLELLDILDVFEPYGEANPKPLFLCRDLIICEMKNVGAKQNHTALTFEAKGRKRLNAIAFNQQYDLNIGCVVDGIFALCRNSYTQSPQLIIENLKYH